MKKTSQGVGRGGPQGFICILYVGALTGAGQECGWSWPEYQRKITAVRGGRGQHVDTPKYSE